MDHKIYLIINDINDKVYVGYTAKSLPWRLGKHFEEVDNNSSPTRKLHRAIKEIGKNHFSIQLLYESNNKNKTLGRKEQEFIDHYDSIKSGYNSRRGGGGIHITEGQCKKVDVYDKNGNFIKTFPSRVAVAEFVECCPSAVTTAISNADKGKGSQVRSVWVCHHGCTPGYKIPNNIPGSEAARKRNQGRKRPDHSTFMKEHPSNEDKHIYKFEHRTGLIFKGTRRELIAAFPNHNISSSELGVLIRGKYKSHRGWKITSQ